MFYIYRYFIVELYIGRPESNYILSALFFYVFAIIDSRIFYYPSTSSFICRHFLIEISNFLKYCLIRLRPRIFKLQWLLANDLQRVHNGVC
ncbi:hypothetical protein T4B_6027 [Trichinella pseudospiralis]|uniref:Uncharacterized protein n=2 Tax=Trichinella pseudospiralis TaxID=6337 RepID=A0A0V1DWJ2_TRIPS|nr:hypothetical protein T4A_10999 [Trichinella pseudospiralis]KRY65793.1 hypothetical protein T4A_5982 [Trichinella pseudospiralis]KRY86172.1 hypothetical protein T4D_12929 [Trichinella pseudospiralis]KRZ03865.1 hypothetical protein T4B_6027 [Trichinella pseudospiralis]KRZ31449.1 hypothetical protein T4C_1592 [Trichinella pseudospiralis]